MDAAELFALGNTQSEQGKHEEAIEAYSRVIELDNKDAVSFYKRGLSHHNLGELYQEKGQNQQAEERFFMAIADYSRAIDLDEKHGKAFNNQGRSHDHLGRLYLHKDQNQQAEERFFMAIADFSHAINLDEKYGKAFNNRGGSHGHLGQLYQQKGQNQQAEERFFMAIADFSRAIDLDEKNGKAFNNRGLSHSKLGELFQQKGQNQQAEERFFLAIADFSRAIDLDEKDGRAFSNRGLTHYHIAQLTSREKYFHLASKDFLMSNFFMRDRDAQLALLLMMREKLIDISPSLALRLVSQQPSWDSAMEWSTLFLDAYSIVYPFQVWFNWLEFQTEIEIEKLALLEALLTWWFGDPVAAFRLFDSFLQTYPGNLMAHHYRLVCADEIQAPVTPYLSQALSLIEPLIPTEKQEKKGLWSKLFSGIEPQGESAPGGAPPTDHLYYAGLILMRAKKKSGRPECFCQHSKVLFTSSLLVRIPGSSGCERTLGVLAGAVYQGGKTSGKAQFYSWSW
jgi:tetratricopeptide (TPR) repeat protein